MPSVAAKLQDALAQHQKGRIAEAERLYEEVLRLDPENFDALHLSGVAAYQAGRIERGAALIARAIARNPRVADAHSNLGNALRALARPAEALASYDAALALKPANAVTHNNRGIVLSELDRQDDALAGIDRALALKPDYAEAHSNRGNVLTKLGRCHDAIASLDIAIGLNPNYAEAFYNRGIALHDLGRLEDSIASYERAIALRANYPAAWYNRGIALHALKRIEAAIESYDRATTLKPDYVEAWWNKALSTLLLARFSEGWPLYEWRKKQPRPIGIRDFPKPAWTGAEDIAGKTVLVCSEQGLGDTIQFSRYIPLLEARGAKAIFCVQDSLSALMRNLSPSVTIINWDTAPPDFDYHAALMSLPLAFATDATNIPARTPYLAAEPARIGKWRSLIGEHGLRIGICWQGKPGPIDKGRSFPLREFERLAHLPGVRLISLQKYDGIEQLSDLPEGMQVETFDAHFDAHFDSGPAAFLDTAALIETLDLVIAPDTAVAHLAGALARPVWIAVNHVSEWRWQMDRSDSPWYPTARLFRQKSRGDWASAFAAIEEAVAAELRARGADRR